MDNSRMSIFDLNEDCQVEIIKQIIVHCDMRDKSLGNKMKYADLVNFALAHENFETLIKEYYYNLYKSLEFVFVANRRELEIDFSVLETTHTGKGGDAFWRVFAHAINKNKVISKVILKFYPKPFQPNFVDHFGIIKRALENKKSLCHVAICLNGYTLEDLNNFGHIIRLYLYVRMSAKTLVEVCKSNPNLKILCFRSTEILGRLSDIAPYCQNLTYLEFAPKPDIDGVEYAPLAELPNLKEMCIYGASENGSLLTIFEAIPKWKRPGLQPLKITFTEFLPDLRNFNIVRTNSVLILLLNTYPGDIELSVCYDFWDISTDSSPLEHSIATIPLATLTIDFEGLILYNCPTSDTDISGLISMLKLFKIQTLKLKVELPIAKLVASIISDESYALKSIVTEFSKIDQFFTSELVKITSITSLSCRYSDWESIELLSALPNLQTMVVDIKNKFEMTSSKALCSLINTCSASGIIQCFDGRIEFRKIESIKGQRKRLTALKIHCYRLSYLFKAFIYRDLITIEELDVLNYFLINIKDILKMAEVQPIKKLRISLAYTKNTEYLSDLAKLEELTICSSVKGSLIKLFERLAIKESPSLQCLLIESKELSSEELVQIPKIISLKKLDLCNYEPEDCESLMELANSNIEELTLAKPQFSLQKLFSAFAVKTTTTLQHLNIKLKRYSISRDLEEQQPNTYLDISELKELSKMQSLKSLQCTCLHNDVSFLRNLNHLVKLDIELLGDSNLGELRCLAELENFESLTLRLNNYSLLQSYDVIADIQNLKELNLLVGRDAYNVADDDESNVILTNVYQTFVSKNVKLTHLTATIGCVEELNVVTQIKSLRKLHLIIRSIDKKMAFLGKLSELESLQITVRTHNYKINCVLPILKCCRNINRLLINSKDYLQDIYIHLKSIRDPTLQGPLDVILTESNNINEEYNIPKILVVLFENVYFKFFASSKHCSFFN